MAPAPSPRVRVAAAAALVLAGLWVLALLLPYVELGSITMSLWDTSRTGNPNELAPRLVGIVLVAATALLTMVVGRPGPWWTTSGALLGLTVISGHWWSGGLDAPGAAHHGTGWYLEGFVCLLAVVVLVVGAWWAVERGGPPRPRTAPYAALAAGATGVVALVAMARNHAFVPVVAVSSDAVWGPAPGTTRAIAALAGVAVVVMPVAAALARRREATLGLALGWLALLAPLVAQVIVVREINPDGLGAPFTMGCGLAGLLTIGLVVWAQVADRSAGPTDGQPAARRATRVLGATQR